MAAVMATGLALSACAPTAGTAAPAESGSTTAAEPVNVGIIYSKTGPLAAYGATYYEGLQAGIDYATGGTGDVNGAKINLTYADDGGDPDKAVDGRQGPDRPGLQDHRRHGRLRHRAQAGRAGRAEQGPLHLRPGRHRRDPGHQQVHVPLGPPEPAGRRHRRHLHRHQAARRSSSSRRTTPSARATSPPSRPSSAPRAPPWRPSWSRTDQEFTPFARQLIDAKPDLVFVAWAGATSGTMWQTLSQQGVFDAAPVVTGLGDAATFGAYGEATDKISFLNHYFPGASGTEVEKTMIAARREGRQEGRPLHPRRLRRRPDDRPGHQGGRRPTSTPWSRRSRASASTAPRARKPSAPRTTP